MATKATSSIPKFLENLGVSEEDWPSYEGAVRRSKSDANILVAGKTGSGKSTVINALCGAVPQQGNTPLYGSYKLPAKEGTTLDHVTQHATCYVARSESVDEASGDAVSQQDESATSRNYTIKVWDTPGLQDGTENDRAYVMQMNVRCVDGIDLLLYCIDISQTRIITDEMVPGMAVMTEILGCDVWKHSIIVLTYANLVKPKRESVSEEDKCHDFLVRVKNCSEKVQQALIRAGVPHDIAYKIPIEPAGKVAIPHLPDRIHWLGYLWLLFMVHAQESAKIALLVNTQNQLRSSDFLSPIDKEALAQSMKSPPLIIIDEQLALHTSILDTIIGPVKKLIKKILKSKREKK
jgi:GTPase SAR1 family protein